MCQHYYEQQDKEEIAEHERKWREHLRKGPHCSFCGLTKDEAGGLILGPLANICGKCAEFAVTELKKQGVL